MECCGPLTVTTVLHETWAYIAKFDIVMLSETQTPAVLHQQLPSHTVHTIPASSIRTGAKIRQGMPAQGKVCRRQNKAEGRIIN